MRQVEEVEGIRWLEVKVLNEENNWEEICIDSICVSSFSPSAVQLIYSCAAANEVLTNKISKKLKSNLVVQSRMNTTQHKAN